MTAKKTAKKRTKRLPPRKLAAADAVTGPGVGWALLTREFLVDRISGARSAFNIVEDVEVPLSAVRPGKTRVVSLDEPLTFAFTLDWKWPTETSTPARLRLDWHSPSGEITVGDAMGEPVERPPGARMTIRVKIADLPVEAAGVYCFDIIVNDQLAARYPVRVRASLKDQLEVLEKLRPKGAYQSAREKTSR